MAKLLVSQRPGAGFDHEGKRVMFDSVCRFNGRPVIQCGIYREIADGTAYVRESTITINQFRSQDRVSASRVMDRINEAILESWDLNDEEY